MFKFLLGAILGSVVTYALIIQSPPEQIELVKEKIVYKSPVKKNKEVTHQPIVAESPPVEKEKLDTNKLLNEAEQNKILTEAYTASHHGDIAKALSKYEELYDNGVKSKHFIEGFAHFTFENRMYSISRDLNDECLRLYPNSSLCLGNLANLALEVDNPTEREGLISQCLKKDSRNVRCINALANHYLSLGEFDQALKTFQQLKALNGTSKTRFFLRLIDWGIGLSLQGIGDLQGAYTAFKSSCSRNHQPACAELEKLEI